MAVAAVTDYRMTAEEAARYERDGFLVREAAFSPAETAAIARDCEELCERIVAVSNGDKHRVGAYMFELQEALEMYVKWEPFAPDLLQGLEPFAHLSDELRAWGMDARILDPARCIVGQDDISMFTEKLNLKRAKKGGEYILHQDYPYWRSHNPAAHRVATAMIFLDDSTRENGCLEAAPGTHKEGVQAMKAVEGFGANEMDPEKFDHSRLVPLEVKAGSIVFFGAFLVHRSLPNLSDQDRRALLYSYHPAGNPSAHETAQRTLAQRKQRLTAG